MTLHVYLDDLRDPHTPRPWVVVRRLDELVELVERKGGVVHSRVTGRNDTKSLKPSKAAKMLTFRGPNV